jgi:hypothetical protein
MFQKIDPSEFGEDINKINIVIVSTNRAWGRPPQVRHGPNGHRSRGLADVHA